MIQEKFDHQDLIEAKKLLSDLGVEVENTDGRRLSPNRSALEADMMDLMTGLENLDLMLELKPKFTAYDWAKVPKVTPEEACNTFSLAIRLSTVEGLLKKLQHDCNNHTENIGTLFDVVSRNNSYAAKAAMSVHAAPSQNSTRDYTLGGIIVQSCVTLETPGVRRLQHSGRPGDIDGTRGQHMANASRLAETTNGNIREQ